MKHSELHVELVLSAEWVERIAACAAELVQEQDGPALPELLTPAEVAEVLRCDRRRVYGLTRSGRLSRVKDGERLLIPRDALQRYLDEGA